jgi:hypothetical protein
MYFVDVTLLGRQATSFYIGPVGFFYAKKN